MAIQRELSLDAGHGLSRTPLLPRASPIQSLTDYHRRRRCSSAPAASAGVCSPGEVEPDLQLSSRRISEDLPFSPCPSPPDVAGLSCMSPLTCPSPAEFVREHIIQQNRRQVHNEYEFGRCLGKGSFGEVHEATHKRTKILRAVKKIHKSGTETVDFEWELQALVALDHPHIVKVIEWFDDEDNYYIVMELCTGVDLSTYVLERMDHAIEGSDASGASALVQEREVSIIIRQCLKSVLCCHASGFVHRDLNAKNFMLTGSDRTVKLIDFGLATRFKGFVPREKFIEIVGTSHYMAPEMMLEGEYSPAVDMWSMGVLLYVLLTGMMLLPKDDERKIVLLKKPGYIDRRLKNCKALEKREASAHVRDLLRRMLERDPKKRITASGALSHPFVRSFWHDHNVADVSHGGEAGKCDIDTDIVAKLRRFGKSPRLKKVAWLMMAHLADHERALLKARRTFRQIDRDGDGEVTLEELKDSVAALSIEAPTDFDEIFAACDSDSSGTMSFVEFLACLLPDSLVDERLCHEAFNLLDKENKGRLSALDLQAIYPHYDMRRCEKMVRQADPTGKGHFDFEDFHRLLRGDESVAAEPARVRARFAKPDRGSPAQPSPSRSPKERYDYDSGIPVIDGELALASFAE